MLAPMQTLSIAAIDALGGTTAIATMLNAPVSTVHSWKRNGIPQSRLAHLKLAAQAAGKEMDWETALVAVPEPESRAA